MNKLTMFQWEGHEVRVDSMNGRFIAADLCRALGFSNTSYIVSGLDPDEKGSSKYDTLGGAQTLLWVTESGFYHLCFKSKHHRAMEFRRKVTEEVIPTIQRTGKYELNSPLAIDNSKVEAIPIRKPSVTPYKVQPDEEVMEDRLEEKSVIAEHRGTIRKLREKLMQEEEAERQAVERLERLFDRLREHMFST